MYLRFCFAAHRASVHGKHLSKAATKQARTLELEFTLAPRPRQEQGTNRNRNKTNERIQEDEASGFGLGPIQNEPIQRSVQLTAQDFPTLSGATSFVPLGRAPPSLTIKHMSRGNSGSGNLTRNDQNFPALASTSDTPSSSVRFSLK